MSTFYLLRGIDYIIGRGREGREGGRGGKSRQASCLKEKRIANQLAREEEEEEEEWGVTKFVVRGR